MPTGLRQVEQGRCNVLRRSSFSAASRPGMQAGMAVAGRWLLVMCLAHSPATSKRQPAHGPSLHAPSPAAATTHQGVQRVPPVPSDTVPLSIGHLLQNDCPSRGWTVPLGQGTALAWPSVATYWPGGALRQPASSLLAPGMAGGSEGQAGHPRWAGRGGQAPGRQAPVGMWWARWTCSGPAAREACGLLRWP